MLARRSSCNEDLKSAFDSLNSEPYQIGVLLENHLNAETLKTHGLDAFKGLFLI